MTRWRQKACGSACRRRGSERAMKGWEQCRSHGPSRARRSTCENAGGGVVDITIYIYEDLARLAGAGAPRRRHGRQANRWATDLTRSRSCSAKVSFWRSLKSHSALVTTAVHCPTRGASGMPRALVFSLGFRVAEHATERVCRQKLIDSRWTMLKPRGKGDRKGCACLSGCAGSPESRCVARTPGTEDEGAACRIRRSRLR